MKTNYSIALLFLLFWGNTFSQREIVPTDSLIINGQIKNPTVFHLAELDTFSLVSIADQVIYNHRGEIKDTLTGMKGIPLKNLLASINFDYEKPKELNEFYFVFTASDGYKVVFSWNEVYNTPLGNQYYILTKMKGKNLADINQRIIFISSGDLKTGRRYIKGLSKIELKRID